MKNLAIAIATVANFGLVGFGGYLYGTLNQQPTTAIGWQINQFGNASASDQLQERLAAEAATVSPLEYQAVKLAEAYCGEAKGQPDEWRWTDENSAPAMTSAIWNRMEDDRFPDTLIDVLLQPSPSGKTLQINALGDAVPENLLAPACAGALEAAAAAVVAMDEDILLPSHTGHSWATPAAAANHSYFSNLEQVAEGSGHQYFGDREPLRLERSARPQSRPAIIVGGNIKVAAAY